MDFNAILDAIVGWLDGAAAFVGTFIGSIQSLEQAPVDTVNGVAGLGDAFKLIKDDILNLLGK